MSDRLSTLFSNSRELNLLATKAKQLMALEQQVALVIPPSLMRGCRVMHLNQQTLTLAANNGAIAAKLRQMATELAAQLRDKGCEVTGIQVQVQVSAPPLVAPNQPAVISTSGKNEISGFASNLPDSPLKEALLRLTRR